MGGGRYRNKDTCNDDERDVVIRPASVPWLVNNMMVIVNCCVGGHCYFSPSRDDGHVFDRANHYFLFCQLQAMLCCLWWFLPVGWTRSSLKGWLMHFLCLTDFFMESLILAQDERWRRA